MLVKILKSEGLMWGYVFIGVLIMIFTKAGIDQTKKIAVPKYVSENYLGWYPPGNWHKKHAYMPQEFSSTRFVPVLDLPKPKAKLQQNQTGVFVDSQQNKLESLQLTKPAEKSLSRNSETSRQTIAIKPIVASGWKSGGIYKIANPKTANNKARQMVINLPKELYFVAECESGMNHYHPKTGAVLKGIKDPDDIGFFQINSRYNGEEAKSLGHNIYTITGNLIHAKYMHERYGLEPWKASKDCWAPKIAKWRAQKKFIKIS